MRAAAGDRVGKSHPEWRANCAANVSRYTFNAKDFKVAFQHRLLLRNAAYYGDVVMNMLPVQCKMARAALDLGIGDLAQRAKVSPDSVARFERGEALEPHTIDAIETALQAAGIEFLSEDNNGGTGVRLRKTAPQGPISIDVEDLNSENDE